MKTILKKVGKFRQCDFDKSFYTDDHDVPALWIDGQIFAIGYGYDDYGQKDKDHIRWLLNPDKEYEITIKEL